MRNKRKNSSSSKYLICFSGEIEALRYNSENDVRFLYFDINMIELLQNLFMSEYLALEAISYEVDRIIDANHEYVSAKSLISRNIEDLFSDCVTRLFVLMGEKAQDAVCLDVTASGSFLFQGENHESTSKV